MLTEKDINRIAKRVINEQSDFSTFEMKELLDDVINRIKEHGTKYILQLNKLNFNFPVEKYKRQPLLKRGDVEPPKGVKISKSVFPED
jgi:hypothetical protein